MRERGGRYYYRKVRIGSCVRSVYVGSSDAASVDAQLLHMARQESEAKHEAERRMISSLAEEDAAFDSIAGMVERVTAAALLASGFHTHKRQWRLSRGDKR
jgi:hypothetical protein